MKRFTLLFFVLILSLCAVQMTLAQEQSKTAPIDELRCIDCDPEPPPPPPPCSNPIDNSFFFVEQQYRDFLFRNPTGAELANDVAPLNSCLHAGDFACYNTERVKMSRRMWDKPEFRQQSRTFGLPLTNGWELYNHEDFILLEYSIYLQRWADTPGYNFWLASLDNCLAGTGGNPTYVSQCYNDSINAFLSSTEYRARFGCP